VVKIGRPSISLNVSQNNRSAIKNNSEQQVNFVTKIVEERKLASSQNQYPSLSPNQSYMKKQNDDYND
jgi:hypothetical protein